MNSDVSKRFVECHDQLKKDGRIKSSRQFALSLDYAPQSFSDIVNGKREVTIELIRKAVEIYKVNTRYLFSGIGSMFEKSIDENPILSVVVDGNGDEKILHVPISAQAGYAHQLYDEEYIAQLPSFTLPDIMFLKGTFRCFGVKGESMEPLLFSGDKVVCSFVEKEFWVNSVKDNQVYVVVSEGGIVVKRLINNITINKKLSCISENPFYEPYELSVNEIKEIWKVEVMISGFLDNHADARSGFYKQIDHLKTIIENQSAQIKTFSNSMELLLKNNGIE